MVVCTSSFIGSYSSNIRRYWSRWIFYIKRILLLRSNTYEGIGRIFIGLLLLNITVRGLKYKKRILGGSILFIISSLFTRNIINENLTNFEIYFSSGTIALFILILIQNSNYKSKTRVQ